MKHPKTVPCYISPLDGQLAFEGSLPEGRAVAMLEADLEAFESRIRYAARKEVLDILEEVNRRQILKPMVVVGEKGKGKKWQLI